MIFHTLRATARYVAFKTYSNYAKLLSFVFGECIWFASPKSRLSAPTTQRSQDLQRPVVCKAWEQGQRYASEL